MSINVLLSKNGVFCRYGNQSFQFENIFAEIWKTIEESTHAKGSNCFIKGKNNEILQPVTCRRCSTKVIFPCSNPQTAPSSLLISLATTIRVIILL